MSVKANKMKEIEKKLILTTRLKIIIYFVSISFAVFCLFNIIFYNMYLQNTKKVVIDEVASNVAQTTEYIDLVLKNVENIADAMSSNPLIQQQIYADSWSSAEGLINIRDSISFMNSLLQNISGAHSISLYLNKHQILVSSDLGLRSNLDDNSISIYSLLTAKYNKQKWVDFYSYQGTLKPLGRGDFITLVRPIFSIYSQFKEGLILINLDRKVFLNYLKLTGNMGNLILDEDGAVIADLVSDSLRSSVKITDLIKPIQDKEKGFITKKINGDEVVIVYNTSKKTNWKFASIISISEPVNKMTKAKDYILLFLVANFISLIVIILLVSRKMFRPVTKLISVMKKVENGDFSVHINEQREDEFGYIYKSFNNMVNRIRYLFGELFQQKLLKKDAELKLMQSQINPHFIHNIFNNMSWLLELKRYDDLEAMIDSVSTYYKTSLNLGNNFILIRDNVEQLKSYAQIQIIRFKDKFECTFDFDEDMLDIKIPNLILQPLLENAICHGVEPSEKHCSIKITGRIQNNVILVTVEDNGVGISQEKLNEIHKNMNNDINIEGNFALVNSHKRIKLYYGEEYGLEISSIPGRGTIAKITIPLEEN